MGTEICSASYYHFICMHLYLYLHPHQSPILLFSTHTSFLLLSATIHSFFQSYIHVFIHVFIYLFICLFILSHAHSHVCLFMDRLRVVSHPLRMFLHDLCGTHRADLQCLSRLRSGWLIRRLVGLVGRWMD